MVYDAVSNLIANINHGYLKNKLSVHIVPNKLVFKLLNILYDIGYIRGFSFNPDRKRVCVFLKYFNNKKVLNFIKRVSTPGHKIYWSYLKLRYMSVKLHYTYVVSTSKGLLLSHEAISKKVGGEILFIIQ